MRLFLSSLVSLAVLVSAAAPADAAFIRRGKIKLKNTTGYKVVVVVGDDTSNDSSDDPATVEVDFPTVSGGSIPGQTMNNGKRRRAHFQDSFIDNFPQSAEIFMDLGDGTTLSAPIEGLEVVAERTESTVVLGDGYKATVRRFVNPNTGPLEDCIEEDVCLTRWRVIVTHQDKFWDPAEIAAVRVGVGSAADDLPLILVTTRFTKNIPESAMPAGFDSGSSYTMATTVKDGLGNVLDSSTQTLTVGDVDPIGPDIERARVSTAPDGDVRVVAWTDGFDAGSGSVQAVLTDDGGSVLLDTLDDMATGTIRLFEYTTLTFDDPDLAADEVYEGTIDAKDAAGNALGSSDFEIVVEGLDPYDLGTNPDGTEFAVTIDGVETKGLIAIARTDATNFTLSVAIAAEAVESVEVNIFTVTGPTPDPENLEFAPFDEWKRWATEGDAGSGTLAGGGSASLEMVLLDDADQVLGLDISNVSDLPDVAFKKRPGAPKGRLRSAKVRAILDPIDWDASGTGTGSGTGSTSTTDAAASGLTSSDPAGSGTTSGVDANIGTSGGFDASASAGFGASASAGFGASASAGASTP